MPDLSAPAASRQASVNGDMAYKCREAACRQKDWAPAFAGVTEVMYG